VVAPLSADDVIEIFGVRGLLEPEALRLAIPHHTKKLWAEASALLDAMEADPASHPWDESNWAWHRLLYSTAGRPRLLAMIENLRVHGDRYVHGGALLAKEKYKSHAGREHREVLRACKRQDVDKACDALSRHIERSLDVLVENLREK
jgi:DNA-binding GntR family transcriptional regulator